MRVRVVSPRPEWPAEFELEAGRIRSALEGGEFLIHHIGSTAIHGIFAKPIIDILLVVQDGLSSLDSRVSAMPSLGYEAMGEFGIVGRRYFRKNSRSGVRTHQVHAFEQGSADVERHLAFRDYMNAHPEAAQAYSSLKQRLAHEFPNDIEAYMDGKDAFIKQHERLALSWQSSGSRGA